MTDSPTAAEHGQALLKHLLESHRSGNDVMSLGAISFLKDRTSGPEELAAAMTAALEEENDWLRSRPYDDIPEPQAHATVRLTLIVAREYLKFPWVYDLDLHAVPADIDEV